MVKAPSGERHYVRPPYRAADYTTPKGAIEAWKAWGPYMIDEVIDLPEADLRSYRLVERYQRDGKPFALWYHATADEEFCIEIEDSGKQIALLEINPVPPEKAYAIARSFDSGVNIPVVDEGAP